MANANANELYRSMHSAILDHGHRRASTDKDTAAPATMVEARPGASFELRNPLHNVVTDRSIDLRWAVANALHFFAATEEAEMLPRYNMRAPRFLSDGKWVGAYGAVAMPQLHRCIELLRQSSHTRKAIVSMGELGVCDVNRPACWSSMQFITSREGLAMIVYQRSCALAVMPYDLVALTSIQAWVAKEVLMDLGSLYWTFGSLHTSNPNEEYKNGPRNGSLIVPYTPDALAILRNPEKAPGDWGYILQQPREVRT